MVGQHANIFKPQIDQNLCADAAFMLHQPLASGRAVQLAARVNMNLREYAGLRGSLDSEAPAGVVQVQKYTAVFLGNGGQRTRHQFVAIASRGCKYISSQAVRVDANQRRLRTFQISAYQGHVLIVVHIAGIRDHPKIAKRGGQNGFREAAHVALMLHPVANQLGHGEHFQVVFAAKFNQLRHAGHRAVFAHDFANHSGRSQSGDPRQVHAGFGLSGANQNSSIARPQRKNMARTRKVLWLGFGIDGRKDRDRTVRGADARTYSHSCVPRLRKCGSVNRSVERRPQRQM